MGRTDFVSASSKNHAKISMEKTLRQRAQPSRFHLLASNAQQGVHTVLLDGVEQTWTNHTSTSCGPLQIMRHGVEFSV